MIRTAFALLALATLAKNDVSGRSQLADACTGILRAFADDVSESHAQRFAPMVSVCPSRNALAMSGIGPHLFHDVMRASESQEWIPTGTAQQLYNHFYQEPNHLSCVLEIIDRIEYV